MIQLVYTGAPKQGQPQIEPLFSLGGFMSSSDVANDFFSNLFPEITLSTLQNNLVEHICLALSTDVDIEDVFLTLITTRNNYGRFRVGAVSVSQDDCGIYKIPKIQNNFSKPVNIKFHDCTSFLGETKIGFSESPNIGETFELYDDEGIVGTIQYDSKFENAWISGSRQEDFTFENRFNYQTKMFELFLIQKNLFNFKSALELIRTSDNVDVLDSENFLPKINRVELGNLTSDKTFALYFERSLSNEYIMQNRKLNCDKMFDDFELDIVPQTIETVELEIEYAEIVTT